MTVRRYACTYCGRPPSGTRCPRCPGGHTTTTRAARRAIVDTLAAIEDPRIDADVPLVHGRVVIDGATYMADLSDDRNQLVARIGYRLKVGWKPQRPRRVEERRPRDGWAEEVAWG